MFEIIKIGCFYIFKYIRLAIFNLGISIVVMEIFKQIPSSLFSNYFEMHDFKLKQNEESSIGVLSRKQSYTINEVTRRLFCP